METLGELRKYMHLHKHPYKRYTFGQTTGWLLLWILHRTKITANQISAWVLFYVLIPLYFISVGTKKSAIIGSVLLLGIITVDHADGALARYRSQMSYMGSYLERMYHRLIPPMLFFALGVYSYKRLNNPWFVLAGILTMYFMFITHWSRLSKYEILILKTKKEIKNVKVSFDKKADKKRLLPKLYNTFIYFVNSIEWMCYFVLILSAFDLLQYMIFFYFPFYALIAAGKLYLEYRSGFKEFGLPYYREEQ